MVLEVCSPIVHHQAGHLPSRRMGFLYEMWCQAFFPLLDGSWEFVPRHLVPNHSGYLICSCNCFWFSWRLVITMSSCCVASLVGVQSSYSRREVRSWYSFDDSSAGDLLLCLSSRWGRDPPSLGDSSVGAFFVVFPRRAGLGPLIPRVFLGWGSFVMSLHSVRSGSTVIREFLYRGSPALFSR